MHFLHSGLFHIVAFSKTDRYFAVSRPG